MDKKTEILRDLKGKVLLFGGAYSNFQALQQLISVAEVQDIVPENCISTGDLVGYCAQPEETVQLFKKWGARAIAGNVEIQLREGSEGCGCDFTKGSRCDGYSQLWYPFAQSQLSQDSLDFMQTLPDYLTFDYGGKKIMIVHGSYSNVSEFVFKSTGWNKKEASFNQTNCDVIIAGHCGIPFYHQRNEKLWINAGVIGMPANDGTPRVWYIILDDEKGVFSFKHHAMDYDHNTASKLMDNGLLPESYAKTLITGVWDNCEILPPVETGLQGYALNL
ncbi:MAG: metallophosphoesterase family protein [Aquaticitalea sp.]